MSETQYRHVDHPDIHFISYEIRKYRDESFEIPVSVRVMVDEVDTDIHFPNTDKKPIFAKKIEEHLNGDIAIKSLRFTLNTTLPMLDRVEQERVESFHIDGVLSVITDEVLRPTGVVVHFPDRMPDSLADLPLHSIFLAEHGRRWYTVLPLSKDLRLVRSKPDGGTTTDPHEIQNYLALMYNITPMHGNDWVVSMVNESDQMVVREIDFR